MEFIISEGGREFTLNLNRSDGRLTAVCGDKTYAVDVQHLSKQHLILRLDGKSYDILLDSDSDATTVNVNGKLATLSVRDARRQALKKLARGTGDDKGPIVLKAPMPGLVLRLLVANGDKIEKNDGLLVIEAMKMENEIRAAAAGVVKKLHVREGQAVEKDQLLLTLE